MQGLGSRFRVEGQGLGWRVSSLFHRGQMCRPKKNTKFSIEEVRFSKPGNFT